MVDNYIGKDRLDYSQIVFRQLDRIGLLMTQTQNQRIRTTAIEDIFSSLNALEALVFFKLSLEDQNKYLAEKEVLNLRYVKIGASAGRVITYEDNFVWFALIMKYLNKSNLLPKERVSYETGVD